MKMTKVFTSFLIILLNFTMFNTAYANTVGGWTLSNPVAQGASTVYSGLKNVLVNGKNIAVTGTATIAPVAANVAKVLARGGAAYALSFAVEQLLGSVEWVLDPANNRIKYYPHSDNPKNNQFMYRIGSDIYSYTSYLDAAEKWFKTAMLPKYPSSYKSFSYVEPNPRANCNYRTGSYYSCNVLVHFINGSNEPADTNILVNQLANPAYDPKAENDEKYLPLPTVAQKVISNAESETDQDKKVAAQEATTAAAADIVQEAENDATKARPIVNELENTATYPSDTTAETKTETKTNENGTTTQESVTDLPAACSWMPSVCEFASKAINFMNSDSVDSDSVETPQRELDSKSFNPNMYASSSQCPADKTLSMNIVGRSYSNTFSFSDICRELSSLSNLVMAAAYAYGAIIIGRDA